MGGKVKMKLTLPKSLVPAVIPVLIAVALCAGGSGAFAQTCPSAAPTCTGAGTVSATNFGCTEVSTDSSGGVKTELLSLSMSSASGGSGTFAAEASSNRNDPTSTTTFKQQSLSGTYCISSDNVSGVFTPTGAPSTSCWLVFVLDNSQTEARLISTEEQKADAVVCRKQ
jgi:hypothetical protein